MNDTEVLAALDDPQTLALTAWAEARAIVLLLNRLGQVASHSPIEELIAVMVVVRNRMTRDVRRVAGGFLHPHGGLSYKSICLAPAQFSCWTPGSGPNHDALMTVARLVTGSDATVAGVRVTPSINLDAEVRECLYLAKGVIGGDLRDRTNGATSYWAPASMQPVGRVPDWAIKDGKPLPFEVIGNQNFLCL
jgi:hypothetical protein